MPPLSLPPQYRSFVSALLAVAIGSCFVSSATADPIEPSNLEQYMLELINRARANPTGEAARYGIDLNEAPDGVELNISPTPKQPVAFNLYLNDSAEDHSQWMIDTDQFQHAGANGTRPSDRARNAGYTLQAPWGVGENLAWKGNVGSLPDPVAYTAELHAGLFVDEGIQDRSHRTNMLNENHKEIGVGIVSGVFTQNAQNYNAVMIATDFAYSAGSAFLTGVVYNDYDQDQFYSPTGEGYDDIAVRAHNVTTGAMYQTTTFATGGYSLQVPPGVYDVTFGGPELLNTTYLSVSMGAQNLKLDVVDSEQLRPWSNPITPFDTDGNGVVEPHDVLVLIDDLNRFGIRSLGTPSEFPPSLYLDVNRDAFFSPADILQVIDAVNRKALLTLPTEGSSNGLLSFVETSSLAAVPEPGGIVLATASLLSLLTLRRLRGMLR